MLGVRYRAATVREWTLAAFPSIRSREMLGVRYRAATVREWTLAAFPSI